MLQVLLNDMSKHIITILINFKNRQLIVGGTYVLPRLIIGGGDPVDKRSTRIKFLSLRKNKMTEAILLSRTDCRVSSENYFSGHPRNDRLFIK